jgi:hypothetical protein
MAATIKRMLREFMGEFWHRRAIPLVMAVTGDW